MKKIILNEQNFKNIFSLINENLENEGGVFWVNNDGNDFDPYNLTANYEYLDDINGKDNKENNYNSKIYIDYSKSPAFKKHPANPTWVEVPWKSKREGSDKLETLDNKNPRDSKPHDGYVRGYGGKLYMPARTSYNGGDNVKTPDTIKPDIIKIDRNISIKCFNLSMLGKNHATMVAHFYKGKAFTINKHAKMSANSFAPSTGKDGKGLNTSILRNFGNIRGYLNNMINLVKNTKGLGDFNPNFIVYPQSSSPFNLQIARALRASVFTNAKIKTGNWIAKEGVWGMDYDSLVYLTSSEVNEYSTFKNTYSQENKDAISYRTAVKRFIEICGNIIIRQLKDLMINAKKEAKRSSQLYKSKLFENMREIFEEEYRNFLKSVIKQGFGRFVKGEIKEMEHDRTLLFVFNKIFSTKNISGWGSGYSSGTNIKNGYAREQQFSSLEKLENAFMRGIVFIKKSVIDSEMKNDTIKNYDGPSRLAIKNQFKLNNDKTEKDMHTWHDNKKITKTKFKNNRFLIIDDNYASGASLRNAAMLLINNGVLPNNIICLTPGDMNAPKTGGNVGAAIAYNYGEGEFADDLRNGGDLKSLTPAERERVNKINNEYGVKSQVHMKRNILNNFIRNERNK